MGSQKFQDVSFSFRRFEVSVLTPDFLCEIFAVDLCIDCCEIFCSRDNEEDVIFRGYNWDLFETLGFDPFIVEDLFDRYFFALGYLNDLFAHVLSGKVVTCKDGSHSEGLSIFVKASQIESCRFCSSHIV